MRSKGIMRHKLFSYFPSQQWLNTSSFINCGKFFFFRLDIVS